MRRQLGMACGAATLVLLVHGGCIESPKVVCENDFICAEGRACDEVHQLCVLPEQLSSCAGSADGIACSYPGVTNGVCIAEVCFASGCGNDQQDPSEICDDGNTVDGDGCSADCQSLEVCGNGIIDTVKQEVCDDADRNSDAPDNDCRTDCGARRCGDGIKDSDELCDDGNNANNDGCSADCLSDESCGNGLVDDLVGEACDDGKHCTDGASCTTDVECAGVGDGACVPRDNDSCHANCASPTCGDGIVDPQFSEGCDCGRDPDNVPAGCNGPNDSSTPDATCRENCQPQRCGDGIQDSGEVCDDGNSNPLDQCTPDCASTVVCGNDYHDYLAGEECDDGNGLSGDGCAHTCELEQPRWAEMTIPTPRYAHAQAYHAALGKLVLFGGLDADDRRDDTWLWDGLAWTDVSTPSSPSARIYHAMAYDAGRERTVFFGGDDGVFRSDTWEWDGAQWTIMAVASSPPARRRHAMAYDAARGKIVLFGGHTGGSTRLNDTWEWDGSSWVEVDVASPPPARSRHTMAYDPIRGKVVMYGGWASADFDDIWEWNGTSWTEIPATNRPPARRAHGMDFDASRGTIVIFGGVGSSGRASDVWELSGTVWSELAQTAGPSDRFDSSMTFDASRGRLVLTGGGASTGATDEVWELVGDDFIQVPTAERPAARGGAALAYDPLRGRVVLFGGNFSGAVHNDTWEWDGRRWTQVSVTSSPPARDNHALVYDTKRGMVVMYGGRDAASLGTYYDDTWTWDGSVWTEILDAGGPARMSAGLAYDTARERIVLFGGYDDFPQGDTWELVDDSWVEIPGLSVSPEIRSSHSMVYDRARGNVVLFGGYDSSTLYKNDTWTWDGTAWTEHDSLAVAPIARLGFAFSYDSVRKRAVLFGGAGSAGQRRDTWTWDGAAWTEVNAIGPDKGAYGSMVYDAKRGKNMLFGGSTNDTWSFRFQTGVGTQDVCRADTSADTDGDGLAGCSDPDCWGHCTPLCPPGTTCSPTASSCGDLTCNTALETCELCPSDCGTCSSDVCGDYVCGAGENATSCALDCP